MSSFALGSACAILFAYSVGVIGPSAAPTTVTTESVEVTPAVTATRRPAVVTPSTSPPTKPPAKKRRTTQRTRRNSPKAPPTKPRKVVPKPKASGLAARVAALAPDDAAGRHRVMDRILGAAKKAPASLQHRVTACVGVAGTTLDGVRAKKKLGQCVDLLQEAGP